MEEKGLGLLEFRKRQSGIPLADSGVCSKARSVDDLKRKKETWFSAVKKKVGLYYYYNI